MPKRSPLLPEITKAAFGPLNLLIEQRGGLELVEDFVSMTSRWLKTIWLERS